MFLWRLQTIVNYVTSFRDVYAYSLGNSVTFTLDNNELHKYTDFCDAKTCWQRRMADMYYLSSDPTKRPSMVQIPKGIGTVKLRYSKWSIKAVFEIEYLNDNSWKSLKSTTRADNNGRARRSKVSFLLSARKIGSDVRIRKFMNG